jgi:hypothetical protein
VQPSIASRGQSASPLAAAAPSNEIILGDPADGGLPSLQSPVPDPADARDLFPSVPTTPAPAIASAPAPASTGRKDWVQSLVKSLIPKSEGASAAPTHSAAKLPVDVAIPALPEPENDPLPDAGGWSFPAAPRKISPTGKAL